MQRGNKLGAVVFGAVLPNGKHSFPTSPTWMLYAGNDTHCIENVPLLISLENFCTAFLAEARVFRCGDKHLFMPLHLPVRPSV